MTILFHTSVSTSAEIQKAIDIIKAQGPDLGLFIRLDKCELYSPQIEATVGLPPEIKRLPIAGLKLLGVFIGTSAFEHDNISECIKQLQPLFNSVPLMEDAQAEFAILRSCLGSSKMNHLLRTTPSTSCSTTFQQFDTTLRQSFERIISRPLSDEQWQLSCLPTRCGGLGLRPAASNHAAAYLASRVETSPLTEVFLQYNWNLRDSKLFQDNFSHLQASIPDLSLDDLFGASSRLQHTLQEKLTRIAFQIYFDQFDLAKK